MPIDQESFLNLEADEEAVAAFLAEHSGEMIRDDRVGESGDRALYWITFTPKRVPTEKYIARYEWFAYPYEPPSIKFVLRIGGSLAEISAWPTMNGYRPGNFDICRPMCREGYGAHQEWRQGSTAWPIEGNPFLWVVQTMQHHFNHDYQGRAA